MSQPSRPLPVDPRFVLRSGEQTQPAKPRPERLWREVVGEQLRDIRGDRGETLHGVAKKAGVSPQYLSEIERGLKEPSSEILAAIGGALETSLLDLAMAAAGRLRSAPARATSSGQFTLAA